jgi:hypothetical protein
VDGGDHGDRISGGDGNDELYGGVGSDDVDGGSDYDIARSVDPDRLLGMESVGIEVDSIQPQNDTTSCGPNAASRLLRFYGHDASYYAARALMRHYPNVVTYLNLGTPPSVLLDILRVWRPESRLESLGNFDRVLELLGSGAPVVALVGFGSISVNFGIFESGTTPRMLHYVTLTGFDRASQRIFYTDTDGARKSWSFAHFNRIWNFPASGATGDFITGTLGVSQRTILY